MTRNRNLIMAALVALFLAAGGYFILRGTGGGGRAVAIDISVRGETMDPTAPAAKQGDRVTMTITADAKEEIHLHGYDIKFETDGPGSRVSRTFTADKAGPFEMEVEGTGKHLGDFTVSP